MTCILITLGVIAVAFIVLVVVGGDIAEDELRKW